MTTGTIKRSPLQQRNPYAYQSVTAEEVLAVIGWHIDHIQREYALVIGDVEKMDSAMNRLYAHQRRLNVMLCHMSGYDTQGKSLSTGPGAGTTGPALNSYQHSYQHSYQPKDEWKEVDLSAPVSKP